MLKKFFLGSTFFYELIMFDALETFMLFMIAMKWYENIWAMIALIFLLKFIKSIMKGLNYDIERSKRRAGRKG